MPDDDSQKFNVGQRAATTAAFKLAGDEGELLVAPITSGDERAFLLEPPTVQSAPGPSRPRAGTHSVAGLQGLGRRKNQTVGRTHTVRVTPRVRRTSSEANPSRIKWGQTAGYPLLGQVVAPMCPPSGDARHSSANRSATVQSADRGTVLLVLAPHDHLAYQADQCALRVRDRCRCVTGSATFATVRDAYLTGRPVRASTTAAVDTVAVLGRY